MSHPVWHFRSKLSFCFQQYHHAKKHRSCVWKKNPEKNNNSVSTRLKVRFVVLAAECEANCHSLLTRGIFFFPMLPAALLRICPNSLRHCLFLLNHTLGPLRVCPHQTLSVFTSAQGDISVTTCFTLASQLFPLQLLRSTAAAGLR